MWFADFPVLGDLPWLQMGMFFAIIAWMLMCLLSVVILGLDSVPAVRVALWAIYGLGGLLLIGNLSGQLIQVTRIERGNFDVQFGSLIYLFFALTGLSGVAFAFLFARAGTKTDDHNQRNRLLYLAMSNILIIIGGLANISPQLRPFPFDVLFDVAAALPMAYAIFRYQLLDITIVIRKGLFYTIPTAVIGTGYFLIVYLIVRLFRTITEYQILLISLLVAAVTAVVIQPLRDKAQSWLDKLFFREKYDSSLMLQRLSHVVASILDLDELTSMVFDEVTTTMHIGRAVFFFREEESGWFHLAAQRGLRRDGDLRLRKDHPLVGWLSSHEHALTRHDVEVIPQFRALWEQERQDLQRMEAELFVPLRAKEKLVGIFAVGPKLSEEMYSPDDQRTLITLANQTAVAIENARLYAAAQQELAERRRVEREIEERRQYLEGVLGSAPDAIVALDAHHRIVEWNLGAERLFGYSREETIGRDIDYLVTNPDTFEEAVGFAQRVMGGKEVPPTETVRYRKDGSPVDVIVAGAPILVGDELIGGVAVYTDVTARKQAEEQIWASLREKEVLLREIHHRVKNNLQVVSSLLSLQSEQTKDRQTFEAFRESQNRIRSMSLVHEKLYRSPDLTRIDLAEYVPSLATALFRSYGADVRGISLSIQADEVFLGIDRAAPCGLLLNELISNALKHAFPAGRAGEIRITLRPAGDNLLTLVVSDNGVGLPQDLDLHHAGSLGLQLVNTLVSQLDGTITLHRHGGTEFEITLAAPGSMSSRIVEEEENGR
jgi:PAS domain S-box-containing protein